MVVAREVRGASEAVCMAGLRSAARGRSAAASIRAGSAPRTGCGLVVGRAEWWHTVQRFGKGGGSCGDAVVVRVFQQGLVRREYLGDGCFNSVWIDGGWLQARVFGEHAFCSVHDVEILPIPRCRFSFALGHVCNACWYCCKVFADDDLWGTQNLNYNHYRSIGSVLTPRQLLIEGFLLTHSLCKQDATMLL